MRNIPLRLIVICLLSVAVGSCKKSGSGSKSPAPNYYLSSVVFSSDQQRTVDSFFYDDRHRLDTLSQTIYDTSSGVPKYNNWMVQFLYQDSNVQQPSWYNYYDISLGGFGDYHLLSYDPLDRITKDTSFSGSGFVTYYSYPDDHIAGTVLFEGNVEDNLMDTLYIKKGNLNEEVVYTSVIPGQPDQWLGTDSYSFSPTTNPAYHQAISGSIGPLLFTLQFINHNSILDFISKNVYNNDLITNPPAPASVSHAYTLTMDDKGRLAKMTLTGGTAAITYSYY